MDTKDVDALKNHLFLSDWKGYGLWVIPVTVLPIVVGIGVIILWIVFKNKIK